MADNPYGAYGASNYEADRRGDHGPGSVAERWERFGRERHRRGPPGRGAERRTFGSEDQAALGYGDDFGPRGRPGEQRGYSNDPYYGAYYGGVYDRAYPGDRDYDRARLEGERGGGVFDGGPADRSHRGKGPKGYTRSDERIREDVNDRLTEDHHLDASDIEVRVQNSEVTLDGTVGARHDKHHAERLAEHTSGVKHVQNNLRVREYRTTATGDGLTGGENEIVNRVAEGRSRLE